MAISVVSSCKSEKDKATPLTIDFTTTIDGTTPNEVKLNANIKGNYDIIRWNFGDEQTLSGETSPTHTYIHKGTYKITLSAWKGLTEFKCEKEIVIEKDILDLDFSLTHNPNNNNTIDFKAIDRTFELTAVSMGNPHAVAFINDVRNFPLEKYGALLEKNERFPRKTNVEFVQVISPNYLLMRVWERGAGVTLACGTGACATLVAAVLTGKSERSATVELPGGPLQILWDEKDNRVYMTGPATEVFTGEYKLSE